MNAQKPESENENITDINTNKKPEPVKPVCALIIALMPDGNLIVVKEVTKQAGLQVERIMNNNEIPGFIIEAFMQALMSQMNDAMLAKINPFAELMMKLQAQGAEVSEQLAGLRQMLTPVEMTEEEAKAAIESLNEGAEIEMPKQEAVTPTAEVHSADQEVPVETIEMPKKSPEIPEEEIPGDITE
jgi:hypothetical protein